jgi:Ser/Thr protein kinase RdoA (MazF antagonist)
LYQVFGIGLRELRSTCGARNVDATLNIAGVLKQYPILTHESRAEALGMAGGLSGALFWRISSPSGTFILRRWPTEHPTRERLTWIHALLTHVDRQGFHLVPVPFRNASSETIISEASHLWELAPWLPGAADYHVSPQPEKLRAAMITLAKFHLAAASFRGNSDATKSAVHKRLERLRELSTNEIARLAHSIDDSTWPELAQPARDAVARLPSAVVTARAQLAPFESASLPLQPCIRDIWHDHILFTGEEVTGLIDFGAADVDTPAGDIARLLGSLVGDDGDRWSAGLAAYESIRSISADERRVLPALDTSANVIAIANWIRWIYVERRKFDNREQVVLRVKNLMNHLPWNSDERL